MIYPDRKQTADATSRKFCCSYDLEKIKNVKVLLAVVLQDSNNQRCKFQVLWVLPDLRQPLLSIFVLLNCVNCVSNDVSNDVVSLTLSTFRRLKFRNGYLNLNDFGRLPLGLLWLGLLWLGILWLGADICTRRHTCMCINTTYGGNP